MQRVRDGVPQDEQAKFDEAVQVITLKTLAERGLSGLATTSPGQMQAGAKARLNGKTAAEIMAEAEALIAARKAKEREQALVEIKELEEKKARAESARVELARFEITKSRFRQVPQRLLGPEPLIELAVRNGTAFAVSRAFFRGTVASAGRAVPWIQEDFDYEVPGGLEPGEAANWSLSPSKFSPWGRAEVPRDAVMTVEVVRLNGQDGSVLFDGEFSNDDVERLAALKDSVR
jgi:hypothetical protein